MAGVVQEMKKNLEAQIVSLANKKKWSELRKKRDQVAKLLPEKLQWLNDTLQNKGKNKGQNKENTNADNEVNQAIATLQQKIDSLVERLEPIEFFSDFS